MSVAAWSLVWQVVIAGTCVAFFGLAASITWGAVRDAADMFRELREAGSQRTETDQDAGRTEPSP
jgi:hypothetical protein